MTRVVTYSEFKQHNNKKDLYVLLHDKVYDVTKFLDEHPGGDEVIIAEAGKDATEAFEDIGHSDEARALLEGMLVGVFDGGEEFKTTSRKVATAPTSSSSTSKSDDSGSVSLFFYLVPVAALGAYFAYQAYT